MKMGCQSSTITKQHTCLVVVDVQNDFCPGGALGTQDGDKIIEPINTIMKNYQQVVATLDNHPAGHYSFASKYGKNPFELHNGDVLWPDHCVKGTEGQKLRAGLSPIEKQFTKGELETPGYSIGENKEFMDYIKQFSQVDVCGIAYDYCVIQSAISIKKVNPNVSVLKNLCSSVDPKNDDNITKQLEEAGVKVIHV